MIDVPIKKLYIPNIYKNEAERLKIFRTSDLLKLLCFDVSQSSESAETFEFLKGLEDYWYKFAVVWNEYEAERPLNHRPSFSQEELFIAGSAPVSELNLSVRASNVCSQAGILFCGSLFAMDAAQVFNLKGSGVKTAKEIAGQVDHYLDCWNRKLALLKARPAQANIGSLDSETSLSLEELSLPLDLLLEAYLSGIFETGDFASPALMKDHPDPSPLLKSAADYWSQFDAVWDKIVQQRMKSGLPPLSKEKLLVNGFQTVDKTGMTRRTVRACQVNQILIVGDLYTMTPVNMAALLRMTNPVQKEIMAFQEYIFQNSAAGHQEQTDVCEDDALNLRPFRQAVEMLSPFFLLGVDSIYASASQRGIHERLIQSYDSNNREEFTRLVFDIPEVLKVFERIWVLEFPDVAVSFERTAEYFRKKNPDFDFQILLDAFVSAGFLETRNGYYLLPKETLQEFFCHEHLFTNREREILLRWLSGETLQSISQSFGVSGERIWKISVLAVGRMPLIYEDYYAPVYQYFHLPKSDFKMIFPELNDEAFEYLSIRWISGKHELTDETIEEYDGPWKEKVRKAYGIMKSIREQDSIGIACSILMENVDTPLTLDELFEKYQKYIKENDLPADKFLRNKRSLSNRLRIRKGIVYNGQNRIRLLSCNSDRLISEIDLSKYKDLVVSADLIFKDNSEFMDEYGIKDGNELFYVLKTSETISRLDLDVRFRRVPMIVFGNGDEKKQAVELLKEMSPVRTDQFNAAYRKKYGVKFPASSPTVFSAVVPYLDGDLYKIDVSFLDPADVPAFKAALEQQDFWFEENARKLFQEVCVHSSPDAFNAASLRQIGYVLNSAYAYSSKYGSLSGYFDAEVRKTGCIDLASVDPRLAGMSVFSAYLLERRKSFDLVDVSSTLMLTMEKVNGKFGLKRDDLFEIQKEILPCCTEEFFNAHSIWNQICQFPLVQKAEGCQWLLDSVLRQNSSILANRIGGTLICTRNPARPSVRDISLWIARKEGRMSISKLKSRFEEIFGAQFQTDRLAYKLREIGCFEQVVDEDPMT